MAQLAQKLRFSLIFLAFWGACWSLPALAGEGPVAGAKGLPAASETLTPGLAGNFLSGRFAMQNKDLKAAARYLNETLARDPTNEQLQQDAMRMHLLAGEVADAIALAHRLAKKNNNEPLVASLLMLEQVKKNDMAAARQAITGASGEGLFGLVRPVMLQWLAVAEKQPPSAVDVRAAIDKAGFFAPFINYHAALMNDVLGNVGTAQLAYAKANVDTAITPYRVLEAIANFHARQGEWAEAQAIYDAYAAANPQSSLIPHKRLAGGAAPAPLVADARQGLAELFFTTASILFGEDATQDTFLYLRIALDLRPNLPPAQLMLANLYEQLGSYPEAIATYDGIADDNVFYRRAQLRKALNYEALGEREKAFALLDTLAARYPDDGAPLITKGDMQRDAKQYAKAAESYGVAIARGEPLGEEDWPLLYARGISYERAGQWPKAEADFTRALTLTPDQPDVLNYLAYSWLTMNKNLAQAREYLEIASEQRPDDAHIIDSVGWAYYLARDYKNALQKFERAIEMLPDDATVNEHLGDVYWRVGRQTEARYQWQRALLFNPDEDQEKLLKDKLANGMPALPAVPPQVSASASPASSAR